MHIQAVMFDIAIHLHNTCTPLLGWITLAFPSRQNITLVEVFSSFKLQGPFVNLNQTLLILTFLSRALAASLVLFSGWHLLINLTMFPSIGVNTYMTTKASTLQGNFDICFSF